MTTVLDRPPRHAVTAHEYLRMAEAGVFAYDARLELIDGEIVEMAPIGSWHAGVVNILTETFVRLVQQRAVVTVQNPIALDDRSVPQPDLALLRPRADRYLKSHPTPAEVLLVVEVSDTTIQIDIGMKAPLYARAAIPEMWIVDLQDRSVRVFRDPTTNGFRTSVTIAAGGRATTLAFADVIVDVDSLFST